eukprot:TRINITY_DN13272_c0_g1_i1.p1 TRINITY_DN13272_c0_g1~~TRINITY_DN13272_c0_g1_i1.p1  ORF type:complete len:602 (-),score=130.57 TRINITY_DN13272_c0_g1_i1:89-1843(-)
MILYDAHKWRTVIWKLRGSVFPKALLWAMPSAILALVLKLLETYDVMSLAQYDFLSKGSVYSGFTFVLGFTLVFRSSQSYTRYTEAARSVDHMRAEWFDACASIIAFTKDSKRTPEELDSFTHTLVRLFSLMHALALEDIGALEDERFPLFDVEGIDKRDLRYLAHEVGEGKRTQVVMTWIKVYIMQGVKKAIIDIPPPILTRVYQELGLGLVNYHDALRIGMWPFPFPYAQLNMFLVIAYLIVTPVVVCVWAPALLECLVFTMISCMSMLGLEFIAAELEHPFGDDDNDLPLLDCQNHFNSDLLVLMNPATFIPPSLSANHCRDHDALACLYQTQQVEMLQAQKRRTYRGIFRKKSTMERVNKRKISKKSVVQQSGVFEGSSDSLQDASTSSVLTGLVNRITSSVPEISAGESSGLPVLPTGEEAEQQASSPLAGMAIVSAESAAPAAAGAPGAQGAEGANAAEAGRWTVDPSAVALSVPKEAVPVVPVTAPAMSREFAELFSNMLRQQEKLQNQLQRHLDEQLRLQRSMLGKHLADFRDRARGSLGVGVDLQPVANVDCDSTVEVAPSCGDPSSQGMCNFGV